MTDRIEPLSSRRRFLSSASSLLGATLAGGVLRGAFHGAGPALDRTHSGHVLRRLYQSLNDDQRRHICVPLDHPSRQLTNTSLILKRPHVIELLSAEQRGLVGLIADLNLSARGRRSYGPLLGRDCGGTDACTLTIYGQPHEPGFHAMLNGGHLLMRTAEATAPLPLFGGPIAYGHQRGDHEYRVPGNAFAFQSDAANAFYSALDPRGRARARANSSPHELQVQLQGSAGSFDGIRIDSAGDQAQRAAMTWLDAVFSSFEPARARALFAALDAQGGASALHAAFYEDGAYYPDRALYARLSAGERSRRGEPYFQRWRLEGPGAIVHFNGTPHVHAYLHVAADPAAQHAGAQVAHADRALQKPDTLRLIVAALRSAAAEPYAFFPPDEIAARIGAGPVTTGLLWSLDPFENSLAVVELRGRALRPIAAEQLARQGAIVRPSGRYRVATTAYFAERNVLGTPERIERHSQRLRDALVQHVQRHGLPDDADAA